MKLFRFLFRFSKTTVILAVIFGLLSGLGTTGLLALISAGLAGNRISTTTLAWSFIALCLIMPVSKFIADILLVRLGQEAIFKLRLKLSRQILAAPLRQLEEMGPHRLLATLTDDLSSIIGSLLFIPVLCISGAIVIGCLIYLGWLSLFVLGVVLCFLVVGVVSYQLPVTRGARYQKLAREESDQLFKHFRALTEGTKELKLHQQRRENFLTKLFQETAASLRRYNIKAMVYFIAAHSWGQVLFFVFIGTLFIFGSRLRTIDIPTMTACTITILYLMGPLEGVMNTLSSLSRASVALDKVERLGLSLAAQTPQTKAAPLQASGQGWRALEMVGVTHSYHHEKEDRSFTLGPINLTFMPGETVFLIGGNGSGKTTLIKLLTGLYKPESGEIRLDAETIKDETLEAYQQNFSVVFSDFYLFEELLGLEETQTDATALQYLTKLQLEHKVQVRDGHLSTTSLSQGQRKRLALLAAFLEDRSIYVFDEWAADQDPQFKEVFYFQLLPELKARGKTIIAITHDDRYYHVADRIIKLVNGQLDDDPQPNQNIPYTLDARLGVTVG